MRHYWLITDTGADKWPHNHRLCEPSEGRDITSPKPTSWREVDCPKCIELYKETFDAGIRSAD